MIFFVLLAVAVSQDRGETYYSALLAKRINGQAEYHLFDGSRIDIFTDQYAIEVDWAGKSLKWAEAIGQASYYARLTGRKPGIVLLTEERRPTDAERVNCLKCLVAAGDIRVWVVSLPEIDSGEIKRLP